MDDLYCTLGLDRACSRDDIAFAYRQKSKIYHPDKPETGDADKFRQVKLAYDVLIDQDRRDRYDRTGRTDDIRATPERVRNFLKQTINACVQAQTKSGITDDPRHENIRDKVLRTMAESRKLIQQNMVDTQRLQRRAADLLERFVVKEGADIGDPVGDCLREEVERLDREMKTHEDAVEMYEAAKTIFETYDYKVDRPSEGQYEFRSTTARAGRSPIGYLGN